MNSATFDELLQQSCLVITASAPLVRRPTLPLLEAAGLRAGQLWQAELRAIDPADGRLILLEPAWKAVLSSLREALEWIQRSLRDDVEDDARFAIEVMTATILEQMDELEVP